MSCLEFYQVLLASESRLVMLRVTARWFMSASVHVGLPVAANCHPTISGSFRMCLSYSFKQILASCQVAFTVPCFCSGAPTCSHITAVVTWYVPCVPTVKPRGIFQSPHLTHCSLSLHTAGQELSFQGCSYSYILGRLFNCSSQDPLSILLTLLSSAQLRALTVGSSPHQPPYWAESPLQ